MSLFICAEVIQRHLRSAERSMRRNRPMRRPDESVSGLYNRPYERALAHFFRNLGERVFFQFLCVAVEFADAFGQLLRRHSILVVHPAEVVLAEVQALLFAWVGF